MPQLKHILFPVDLSNAVRSFAPLVRTVACRAGARVTMLNTLELPPGYYSNPYALLTFGDLMGSMRRQRREYREFLRDEFAGLPSLVRVSKHGPVEETILSYAQKRKVDMIMMPTHGLGAFRQWLLGSVTAKVLHDARCPVWTGAHSEEIAPPPQVSRILCAVDLGESSIAVTQYADWLSKLFGAQLAFLTVCAVGESWTVRHFETEFVERMEGVAREKLSALLDKAGVNGEIAIRSGDIARCVRREAIDWDADVIVIGHGRSREPYNIIRESPCSVVSV